MKKRHWGAVFIVAFIVTTMGIACPLTAAGQTIPMPAGQEVYSFDPLSLPFVSSDPAQSRPVGLGPLATGGDIFNIPPG